MTGALESDSLDPDDVPCMPKNQADDDDEEYSALLKTMGPEISNLGLEIPKKKAKSHNPM